MVLMALGRAYFMRLESITSKLKSLDIPIPIAFIVHQALNCLPAQISQLKTTYNEQRDKWNVNELISVCA